MGDGMTREEIIEELRSINTYWDEEKEAIEAAIMALQAQEDMISRKEKGE